MTVAAYPGLIPQIQQDFSAGAFPGMEVIPPNGAEDIVNGVIADDGSLFDRGSAVYKQTNSVTLTGPARGLWDGDLMSGSRTLVMGSDSLRVLEADDATLAVLDNSARFDRAVRPVEYGRMLIFPYSTPFDNFAIYGGALPSVQGLTVPTVAQTVTFTQGSRVVVAGGGSNFDAGKANPGAVISFTAGIDGLARMGVVESVQDATHLTLTEPWPFGTITSAAGDYRIAPVWSAIPDVPWKTGTAKYVATIAQRLVVAMGNKVWFSGFLQDATGQSWPTPLRFDKTDFHTLPEGGSIIGLAPSRDVMLVFTSKGMWAIYGMALDLTDAMGNPQQRLGLVTRDVVLWGQGGVSSWRNALVVPALDDVYLVDAVSSPRPFAGGAQRLYRSYVRAGYLPGQAEIHRGHYVLPILDGAENVVDTMVWRLEAAGIPFTRWDGYGGLSRAFVQRSRAGQPPALLGLSGAPTTPRITDMSAALDQSSSGATDADGSSHDLKITTRTLTAPGFISQMWRRFRARMETSSTMTASLEYATGKPGSSFFSVGSPQVISTDNEQVWSWSLSKRARAIRFRLTLHSSGSREVLRAFEVFSRPGGRR